MRDGITRPVRVAIETLGCKLNQAESELLTRQLQQEGYQVVASSQIADIYILNTCTVTHIADRKSRHFLRMVHRRNPEARLIVTGCYAQRAAEILYQIEGVTRVMDNSQKSRLIQAVKDASAGITTICPDCDESALPRISRTRSLVKIQEGCTNFCSYCIVPFMRGAETSVPAELVIGEVKARIVEGYREVVLTGTRVGAYKDDNTGLPQLLARILDETTIDRVRLSSVQPQELSPELLHIWQNSRMCRHFHLSLQSGSDNMLHRMKRKYISAEYQRALALIRDMVPEAAITTDVIVGFPGESEGAFEVSRDFCKQQNYARIHVFPYSPREHTAAEKMVGMVSDADKKRRVAIMLTLAEEIARAFTERFIGKELEVLWEQPDDNGLWSGLTDNYLKVYAHSAENLENTISTVRAKELFSDGILAELR